MKGALGSAYLLSQTQLAKSEILHWHLIMKNGTFTSYPTLTPIWSLVYWEEGGGGHNTP